MMREGFGGEIVVGMDSVSHIVCFYVMCSFLYFVFYWSIYTLKYELSYSLCYHYLVFH